jgi:hypothetical protein
MSMRHGVRKWAEVDPHLRDVRRAGRVASEVESFSSVPAHHVKRHLIQAQSTAIARAMASICNDEQGGF